jgi:hypothetical protein
MLLENFVKRACSIAKFGHGREDEAADIFGNLIMLMLLSTMYFIFRVMLLSRIGIRSYSMTEMVQDVEEGTLPNSRVSARI